MSLYFIKRIFILLIISALSTVANAAQPSQTEIDGALAAATAQGRIVTIGTGGMNIPASLQQLTSLPVIFRNTLSDWPYDIVVMKMDITPSGSVVTVACRFEIPQSEGRSYLYFGSDNIAVSGKNGFSGDLSILQSTLSDAKASEIDDPTNLLAGQTRFVEFPLPLFRSKSWLGLGQNTKLRFQCGEFKGFTLSGFMKIYDLLKREDSNGNLLTDGKPFMLFWGNQEVYDWQDMFFTATASRAVRSAFSDDLGFHWTSKTQILIDLSKYQNPANVPACGGAISDAWQGLRFDAFDVRLPRLFKLRTARTLMGAGADLFFDPNGLLGNVTAQDVYSLEEGYTDELNKYDMSLDRVTANLGCNTKTILNLQGRIRFGKCDTNNSKNKELNYNVLYNGLENQYQVFIKESTQDRFLNSGLTLSTGSTVSVRVSEGEFIFKTALAAKPRLTTPAYNNSICLNYPTTVSVENCGTQFSRWSTGATNTNSININPLTTTTYKVNCYDKFCIQEDAEDLTITVYESLPKPSLTASPSSICTYQSSVLIASNCVGKMEWRTPSMTGFGEIGTNSREQLAVHPGVGATTSYPYEVRCNLNGCLSNEQSLSLTVHPEPSKPNLGSNAPANTIDRGGSVTLSGSCELNHTLLWENLPQNPMTLYNSATYSAYCINDATRCRSQSQSIGINVLYFPPGAPFLSVSGTGTSYVGLSWMDNSNNEDGFWVYRSSSPDFSGAVRIADLPANTTSYTNAGLGEGQTYYYRVISHNRYDQGTSNTVTGGTSTTPIDQPIDNTPTCTVLAPSMSTSSSTITVGDVVTVDASCAYGSVVWIQPGDFGGGSHQPNTTTTYEAKCSVSSSCVSGTTKKVVSVNQVGCTTPEPPFVDGSATICAGASATLLASGCDGGSITWSSGTNQVQPDVTTDYTATCTKDGCTSGASNSFRVTVIRVSKPNITLSASNINKGEKVTVSASCDGNTVIWTAPAGFSGGDDYPSSNTTYSAKCKDGNNCESGEESKTVTVGCPPVTAPTISVSDITVPRGTQGELTALGCEGGTVRWSNGKTGESITVNPGSYTATCKVTNDCGNFGESKATGKVNEEGCPEVTAPPISVSDATVASGSKGELTATGCVGGTITWSNGETGKSITVDPGSYTATCKVTNDCGNSDESEATGKVSVEGCVPPPVPKDLKAGKYELDEGETTTLSATSAYPVIWLKDGRYFDQPDRASPGKYKARATNGSCDSEYSGEIEIKPKVIPIEAIAYTGIWLLCDGEASTPKSFSGCVGGNITVLKDGSAYTDNNLTPGQNYSAQCYRGSTITARTTFSVTSGSKPSGPSISPIVAIVEAGRTITLVASATGASSYRWSTNETGDRITVRPSSRTDYSVTAYSEANQSGCESSAASRTVMVNSPCTPQPSKPNITSTKDAICPTEQTTLTVTGCNGTMTWEDNGLSTNPRTVSAGTYTAKCTTACGSESTSKTISQPNIPVLSIGRNGNTLTVTATTGCTSDFTWYKEDSSTSSTRGRNIATGNSVNIITHGLGRYEAVCNSDCGEKNAITYIPN